MVYKQLSARIRSDYEAKEYPDGHLEPIWLFCTYWLFRYLI